MGGQRSIQVSGLIIRFIALKSRAMYQYGVGGGGLSKEKKNFGNPPCQLLMSGVKVFFLFVKLKSCMI